MDDDSVGVEEEDGGESARGARKETRAGGIESGVEVDGVVVGRYSRRD